MNNLKVGVIGTGHLGKLHVKMFKHLKNCEIIGVYDKNFIQSKAAASEYDVNEFEDLNALINEVEAVSIAATTSSHYELVKKALEMGKHVFVEKPITTTISEAEELVRISGRSY